MELMRLRQELVKAESSLYPAIAQHSSLYCTKAQWLETKNLRIPDDDADDGDDDGDDDDGGNDDDGGDLSDVGDDLGAGGGGGTRAGGRVGKAVHLPCQS